MYDVSAQGVDERMMNVHYYYLIQFLQQSYGAISSFCWGEAGDSSCCFLDLLLVITVTVLLG